MRLGGDKLEDNMFSKNLQLLRKRSGLTQQELVDILNSKYDTQINRTTISKWEHGTQEASMSVVKKLADFFNVSMDFLNGRTTPTLDSIDEVFGSLNPTNQAKLFELANLYLADQRNKKEK